jgi:glycosyltransferase involved in cell wall biosynthesis
MRRADMRRAVTRSAVTRRAGLKVLHTIGEMGTGGAESLVVELVRGGGTVGWHSAVASAGGWREEELSAVPGLTLYRVPLSRRRPTGLLRAVRATRRAIQADDPDVVVAHNVGVTVATWLALRTLRHRAPLVTVFHGVAATDYRAAARVLNRCPAAVVTVSSTILARLRAAGLRPRRTEVIRNAITAPPLPSREQARRELDLDPGIPIALCAARMVDQKRHDVLLQAWAHVSTPALLLLAGDGPNRDAVHAQVTELGLGERVRLLGVRDDVPRLLAACDLSTLASDWEGLPVAVLESMAAGRPVVATAVDGVAEAVGHGGGVLVPAGDPAALAAALDSLLGDLDRCHDEGVAAQGVIADYYDPRQLMAGYDQLLRSLVSPIGTPDPPADLAWQDDETRTA